MKSEQEFRSLTMKTKKRSQENEFCFKKTSSLNRIFRNRSLRPLFSEIRCCQNVEKEETTILYMLTNL